MTPAQFRRAALALPAATEGAHMGHADFRVGNKIFATLGYPDRGFAMVKLTPQQQATLCRENPKAFMPVAGGWGRNGATNVRLAQAELWTVRPALLLAFENAAPKSLRATRDADRDGAAVRRAFARALKAARATRLPGIEPAASYGTPSLTVHGKFLMRVKDADTLVFRCTMEEKAFLIEAAPSIYFETDHYVGWPMVLARLKPASDTELRHCVERAWRLQAPKKLRAGRENPASAKSKAKKKP